MMSRNGRSAIGRLTAITATPGYFETLKLPLMSGRFFNDSDTDTSPKVIIIDDQQ